jgi:peptide/nickel transport system substrate-binding protein
MKTTTWRRYGQRLVPVCAGVMLVAAAACGSTSTGTTAAQDLTVAGPVPLVDLDPLGANALEDPTQELDQHIFDAVVVRDNGNIEPHLATSWTNPTPDTWDFTIRSGVKFTNGTPLTAADIQWSLQELIKENGPLAPLWSALSTVEAPSATSLVITTTTPVGDMLNNISLLYVVPMNLAGNANFYLHPIGSGPFIVKSFTPNQSIVIVKNPHYWGGAPKLDQITFANITDVSAQVTALENGQIQVTWGLPPDQLQTVESDPNIHVVTKPSLSFYYQWFNSSVKPFNDVRVRQALWYALDLKTMDSSLFGDQATVAQAPITTTTFGFAAQPPYAYDPTKAKQLLAEAGYPNGFSTTISYSTTCCADISEVAQSMISYWAAIGVTVTAVPEEQATWVSNLLALKWNMNLAENETVTGSANSTIGRLYTCAAHRTGYCNAQLDAIIQQAQQSTDRTQQAALWAQAIQIIWSQAVGISLFDVNQNFEYADSVQGFVPPEYTFPFFYTVSLSK